MKYMVEYSIAQRIHGLYAVTPDMADTVQLCRLVQASIEGGARVVQYRNKVADSRLRIKQASALHAICKAAGVTYMINDHVKLCLALDADGVHVGSDDGDLSAIKARIGPEKILGASCYNRIELALQAQEAGADYVAFGACFSSSTKPHAPNASLDLFQANLQVPKVAIGGITLQNAPRVVHAGADAIAVIGALFGAPDVREQALAFSQMFALPH